MKKCTPFHLGVFLAVTILVTACGGTTSPTTLPSVETVSSNAPKGYMDAEPSYVLFIQWTEKNGQMSGQFQDVYITANNPLQVQQDNQAFTGIHNGSNVSMSLSVFGFTKTYTGNLNGDTLTLVVPRQDGTLNTLDLHVTSVDGYNTAATDLMKHVQEQAVQATATVQASQSQTAIVVHIYDNASVLNPSQIQSAAVNLPYSMDIYTVKNFNGTKAAFEQQTASHTAGNPNLIVMAIDTVHHFVFVSSGSRVPLSNSQATDAANSFASNFSSGYTNATLAAINSLQSSLRTSDTIPSIHVI